MGSTPEQEGQHEEPGLPAPRRGGEPGADPTVMSGPDGLEGPGTSLGPYKLLQMIGEGGFGVVYMAQQTAPVRRRVAIKVVKPGMDSKQVIGRFESERQALAMMDHPNIARVFDAGTTANGRPYFVMELVKGVPVTEYCDDANLTTEERLRLFVTVCDAIQHAHNKGIIHRDLKPSNVLITLHDDKPVVKVIDFGIAKAMNQDLTEATVFTEFRQFIGTPEYMSPEQAAMSGLDVDTRSDVYSLGVMLYELVTGTTPFDSDKLRSAGLAEVQRIIKEEDPPRPSTRISAVSRQSREEKARTGTGGRTTAEAIARHRRTDPRSLRRALAGDLDWIVMKCLEKDRQRRYETASELALDIERFLRHEAILAHPPTASYRFRKFVSRNRGLASAGIGVVCALLLTMVALAYGLLQAQHERDMTIQAQTEARAMMVLDGMNAVRKYTTEKVRPALLGEHKDGQADPYANFQPEMVPAFAARSVFERVRAQPGHEGFIYHEASPNPTSRENLADEFERALVDRFKKEPDTKVISDTTRLPDGRSAFYIARPMRVGDKACLECHTTPEMAPRRQVELYGDKGGYGWQLGDVVAAQVVYAPVADGFRRAPRVPDGAFGVLIGVLVVGGVVSLWAVRRA
ncbi:MAG: protein kinase [Phycisphaerales bacterium]